MARIHRMTKKRLGELLVDEGLISEEQVQEVLDEQKKSGGLFGEILVRKSYVTESDIARTIARQFSIPFISAKGYEIDLEAARMFALDMLNRYQFVPIDRFGDVLNVVIAGVLHRTVLEQIEEVSGCSVQVYAGTATDVKEAIKKIGDERAKNPVEPEPVPDKANETVQTEKVAPSGDTEKIEKPAEENSEGKKEGFLSSLYKKHHENEPEASDPKPVENAPSQPPEKEQKPEEEQGPPLSPYGGGTP